MTMWSQSFVEADTIVTGFIWVGLGRLGKINDIKAKEKEIKNYFLSLFRFVQDSVQDLRIICMYVCKNSINQGKLEILNNLKQNN